MTTPEKSQYKRIAYFDFINMVFDGIYKDYNKDDVLIAEGYYDHGAKAGLHNEYYNNRALKSTIEYQGNDFTIWEFRDQRIKDSIKNGTGRFTMYYFYLSGLVSQPSWKQGILNGEFVFGKRAGIWIYEDTNKKKTDEEIYEKGKLVKRIHFSEPTTVELDYKKEIIISVNSILSEAIAFDHNTFTSLNQVFEQQMAYPVSFQRPVTYPGGVKRLLLLLARHAEIPEGNVTILKLKVDEHGNVLKYGIEESAGPEIDNQAMKAIKVHENKFLPAIKNGKPYPSTIFLPVSGGQNWIDFLNTTPIEEVLMMR